MEGPFLFIICVPEIEKSHSHTSYSSGVLYDHFSQKTYILNVKNVIMNDRNGLSNLWCFFRTRPISAESLSLHMSRIWYQINKPFSNPPHPQCCCVTFLSTLMSVCLLVYDGLLVGLFVCHYFLKLLSYLLIQGLNFCCVASL